MENCNTTETNVAEKLQQLRNHVPFLESVISRYKFESALDPVRQDEQEKFEMLHKLLTKNESKMKMETLLKCESVLIKLRLKMDKSFHLPLFDGEEDSCPESPPPQEVIAEDNSEPIVIPTERRDSPFEMNSSGKNHKNTSKYHRDSTMVTSRSRLDLYSQTGHERYSSHGHNDRIKNYDFNRHHRDHDRERVRTPDHERIRTPDHERNRTPERDYNKSYKKNHHDRYYECSSHDKSSSSRNHGSSKSYRNDRRSRSCSRSRSGSQSRSPPRKKNRKRSRSRSISHTRSHSRSRSRSLSRSRGQSYEKFSKHKGSHSPETSKDRNYRRSRSPSCSRSSDKQNQTPKYSSAKNSPYHHDQNHRSRSKEKHNDRLQHIRRRSEHSSSPWKDFPLDCDARSTNISSDISKSNVNKSVYGKRYDHEIKKYSIDKKLNQKQLEALYKKLNVPLPSQSAIIKKHPTDNTPYSPEESWNDVDSSPDQSNPSKSSKNSKSVFSRLGLKVNDKDSNVDKKKNDKTTLTDADILKGPPLNDNDLTNLLQECGDNVNIEDICSRRPPKEPPIPAKTSFELVRKKLAQVAKNGSDTPSSPTLVEIDKNITGMLNNQDNNKKTIKNSVANTPSRRKSMDVSSTSINQMNIAATTNSYDPRLRKTTGVDIDERLHLNNFQHLNMLPGFSGGNSTNNSNDSILTRMDPRLQRSQSTNQFNNVIHQKTPLLPTPNVGSHQMNNLMKSTLGSSAHVNVYPGHYNTGIHNITPQSPNITSPNPFNTGIHNLMSPSQNLASPNLYNLSIHNMVPQSQNITSPNIHNLMLQSSNISSPNTYNSGIHNLVTQSSIIPGGNVSNFHRIGNNNNNNNKNNKSNTNNNSKNNNNNNRNDFQNRSQNYHFNRLNAKINPALNDSHERSKYFESKKTRQTNCKTYKEYREQRKAKEAAENAAIAAKNLKRHLEEARKAMDISSDQEKSSDKPEDAGTNNNKRLNDIPTTESKLDKMYRNSNFTKLALPNTNISFKIPKKAPVHKPDGNESNKTGAKGKQLNKKEKEKEKEKDKDGEKKSEKQLSKVQQEKGKNSEENRKEASKSKKDSPIRNDSSQESEETQENLDDSTALIIDDIHDSQQSLDNLNVETLGSSKSPDNLVIERNDSSKSSDNVQVEDNDPTKSSDNSEAEKVSTAEESNPKDIYHSNEKESADDGNENESLKADRNFSTEESQEENITQQSSLSSSSSGVLDDSNDVIRVTKRAGVSYFYKVINDDELEDDDNTVISTKNILTGKRTRHSINQNETSKDNKKSLPKTPKSGERKNKDDAVLRKKSIQAKKKIKPKTLSNTIDRDHLDDVNDQDHPKDSEEISPSMDESKSPSESSEETMKTKDSVDMNDDSNTKISEETNLSKEIRTPPTTVEETISNDLISPTDDTHSLNSKQKNSDDNEMNSTNMIEEDIKVEEQSDSENSTFDLEDKFSLKILRSKSRALSSINSCIVSPVLPTTSHKKGRSGRIRPKTVTKRRICLENSEIMDNNVNNDADNNEENLSEISINDFNETEIEDTLQGTLIMDTLYGYLLMPNFNIDATLSIYKKRLDPLVYKEVERRVKIFRENQKASTNSKDESSEGNHNHGPKRKKGELERLSEDIGEMYIGADILTLTGKRRITRTRTNNGEASSATSSSKSSTENPHKRLCRNVNNDENQNSHLDAPKLRPLHIRVKRTKIDHPNSTQEDSNDSSLTCSKSGNDQVPSMGVNKSKMDARRKQNVPKKGKSKNFIGPKSIKAAFLANNRSTKTKNTVEKLKDATVVTEHVLSSDDNLDSSLDSNINSQDFSNFDGKVKNVDLMWHAQSKYNHTCLICNTKQRQIIEHYVQMHDECYISRFTPTMLREFKKHFKLAVPKFGIKYHFTVKWYHNCSFCLKQWELTMPDWIKHYKNHTGEFDLKCSKCSKPFNRHNRLQNHIKTFCPGAEVVRNSSNIDINYKDVIPIHVCHLCNFMQLSRINLERHYHIQHNSNPSLIKEMGYPLTLFDVRNAKIVDEDTAILLKQQELMKIDIPLTDALITTISDPNPNPNPGSTTTNSRSHLPKLMPIKTQTSMKTLLINKNENENPRTTNMRDTSIEMISLDEKPRRTMSDEDCEATLVEVLAELEHQQSLDGIESPTKLSFSTSGNVDPVASIALHLQDHGNHTSLLNQDHCSGESPSFHDTSKMTSLDEMLKSVGKFINPEEFLNSTLASHQESPVGLIRSNFVSSKNNAACSNDDSDVIELTDTQESLNDIDSLQSLSILSQEAPSSSPEKGQSSLGKEQQSPEKGPTSLEKEQSSLEKEATSPEKYPPSLEKEQQSPEKGPTSLEKEQSSFEKEQSSFEKEQSFFETEQSSPEKEKPSPRKLLGESHEENEEDWEDIEVTESAPTPSPLTKQSKFKMRNIRNINGLYGIKMTKNVKKNLPINRKPDKKNQTEKTAPEFTNQSSKQELTNLDGSNKELANPSSAESNKELANPSSAGSNKELSKPSSGGSNKELSNPTTSGTSNAGLSTDITKSNVEFRPLLTCLADSPHDLNEVDPIELLPHLNPSSPLPNLNDLLDIDILSVNPSSSIINPCQNPDNVIKKQGIQNLAFSISSNNVKFYCTLEHCNFLFSNDSDGLHGHFRIDHPNVKWNGFCKTCDKSFAENPQNLPIDMELKHMMEYHINKTHNIDDHDGENQIHSSLNEEEMKKPRINVRRFSGDCLTEAVDLNTQQPSLFDMMNTSSTSDMESCYQPIDLTDSPDNDKEPSNDIFCNLSLRDLLIAKSKPPNFAPFESNHQEQQTKPQSQSQQQLQTQSQNQSQINSQPQSQPQSQLQSQPQSKPQLQPQPQAQSKPQSQPQPQTQSQPHLQLQTPTQIKNLDSDSEKCPTSLEENIKSKSSSSDSKPPMLKVASVASINERYCGSSTSSENEKPQSSSPSNFFPSLPLLPELYRLQAEEEEIYVPNNNVEIIDPLSFKDPLDSSISVAQATSGPFILTQTVSENTVFGIEITVSPEAIPVNQVPISSNVNRFKRPIRCCYIGCSYEASQLMPLCEHFTSIHVSNTNSPKRNCSDCNYQPVNHEDFLEHVLTCHLYSTTSETTTTASNPTSKMISSTLPPSSSASTVFTNLLSTTTNNNGPVPKLSTVDEVARKIRETFNKNAQGSALLPVQRNIGQKQPTKPEITIAAIKETIEEIRQQTGIPDNELYRCVYNACTEVIADKEVAQHLRTKHGKTNKSRFKCRHCAVFSSTLNDLQNHLKDHNSHNYFCYICFESGPNLDSLFKHFRTVHSFYRHVKTRGFFDESLTEEEKSEKKEKKEGPLFYVSHSVAITEVQIKDFASKLVQHWQRKKASLKTHFDPLEIDLLPTSQIFKDQLYCVTCNYGSKVRTNLIRHLQMHTSGEAGMKTVTHDPVNPVPCLSNKEKHFDKMMNLASASVLKVLSQSKEENPEAEPSQEKIADLNTAATAAVGNFQVKYAFIEENKRYTCGVVGCNSITITDELFRSHLSALHSNMTNYSCPFCHEEICKSFSIERIIQHLRYHSVKLFQCGSCTYVHYLKKVVERHVHDKHSDVTISFIISYNRTQHGDLEGQKTIQSCKGKKDLQEKLMKKVRTSGKTQQGPPHTKKKPPRLEATKITSTSNSPPSTTSNTLCHIKETKSPDSSKIEAPKNPSEKYFFKCHHCDFKGNYQSIQKDHYPMAHKTTQTNEVQSDSKPFLCDLIPNPNSSIADGKKLLNRNVIKEISHFYSDEGPIYVQCLKCLDLIPHSQAIDVHKCFPGQQTKSDETMFRQLYSDILYLCFECDFVTLQEKNIYLHIMDHHESIAKCLYCDQMQDSFNSYMQHIYNEHKDNVHEFGKNFSFDKLKEFFMKVLIILPSGAVIPKAKIVRNNPLAGEKDMWAAYDELRTIALQPPIPRIPLGLMFRRYSTAND